MPLVDALVRASHPCSYQEVCDDAPGSTLLRWFDYRRNVLLLSGRTPKGLRRLLGNVQEVFRAACLAQEGLEAVAVVPDLGWTDPGSLEGRAEKSGVWIVPPITIREGRESCRVVARDRRALRDFTDGLRRSGPVELLSISAQGNIGAIRGLPEASVHLLEGLTDAQVRSIVAAWNAGLFEVPARARWESVSDRLGLARSTFGEHLRKGQYRLLAYSIMALRTRASSVPDRVILPPLPVSHMGTKGPLRGVRDGSEGGGELPL